MAVAALRLYGVAALTDRNGKALAPQTTLVVQRELGAVVRVAPFNAVEMSDRELDDYRQVIDSVFEETTVLPAPFGTVFRSADHVQRWLKAHHLALNEGIHLVQGRCEMRVHVSHRRESAPAAGAPPVSEVRDTRDDERRWGELNAQAADIFRQLRRNVSAAVPLRPAQPVSSSGSAFLVERTQWRDFVEAVSVMAKRADELRVETSGPWPPFAFVRMDLGA
ncbi:MAG: GvpL/GvpF family gas vesicle protein [Gemmatimonadaceae bacterium]